MRYPANTVAYEFENSRLDQNGENALTAVNGGGTFKTISPSPAFGSYCFAEASAKWDVIPSTAEVNLTSATKWTIEQRIFLPTKTAGVKATQSVWRGPVAKPTGSMGLIILTSSDWDPWGAQMFMWFNSDSLFLASWSDSNYLNATPNAWNRFTFCFDSGVYKLYINGTLSYTSGTGKANLFATALDFKTAGYDVEWSSITGMDRLVILPNINTAGVEIILLPDGKTGIRAGFTVGGNSRVKIGGFTI